MNGYLALAFSVFVLICVAAVASQVDDQAATVWAVGAGLIGLLFASWLIPWIRRLADERRRVSAVLEGRILPEESSLPTQPPDKPTVSETEDLSASNLRQRLSSRKGWEATEYGATHESVSVVVAGYVGDLSIEVRASGNGRRAIASSVKPIQGKLREMASDLPDIEFVTGGLRFACTSTVDEGIADIDQALLVCQLLNAPTALEQTERLIALDELEADEVADIAETLEASDRWGLAHALADAHPMRALAAAEHLEPGPLVELALHLLKGASPAEDIRGALSRLLGGVEDDVPTAERGRYNQAIALVRQQGQLSLSGREVDVGGLAIASGGRGDLSPSE